MARSLDAGTLAACTASTGSVLVVAVALQFSGGWVYANTGPMALLIDGILYPGVGRLGKVGTIQESGENQSFTTVVSLSGVDPALLGDAIAQTTQGLPGSVSLVWLDNATYQVLGGPLVVAAGTMDAMSIKISGGTATIMVPLNDRRADWQRPRLRVWSDLDQQTYWPGDLFCALVQAMQTKVTPFGPTTAVAG